MEKIHLLIIDPQRDFCDPEGALSVPGADKDMERLARMVAKAGHQIESIHCTLDSHHLFDISHPVFWRNPEGKHPEPFTIISEADVENGLWKAANPAYEAHARAYVSRLEANKRYPLCVWPPHCLIGTKGHNVSPVLSHALFAWEENQLAAVNHVVKGTNPGTEHYSAVQADVPDPEDPSTLMNKAFVRMLGSADILAVAGEALSHCVKFTVEDIAAADGSLIPKMVLIEDCCSSVPGFEEQGADFVKAMTARGMRLAKAGDFLAGRFSGK